MKYKEYFHIILITSFICISCVTPKRIYPVGDLCGVIVDENNNPVSNYLIICSNNGTYREATITNNSGIFVFSNIKTGIYYLQGEKENFESLKKREYTFNDSSSIFCCQVSTVDDLLEKVDLFINAGEYQKGVDLLNNVIVKEDKESKAIVLAYKAYLFKMLGQKFSYKKNLYELKRIKKSEVLNFEEIMEKKNYEEE